MSITTCQKVTLISCSVLCISLFLPRMLLPREKKDMGQPEVGPGFYPPVMRQLSLPEDTERWGVDPSYSMTRSAEAMAKAKGNGRGKKYNLMAQVIPIYGFGILLYILYIIYKLTCRGKTKPGNSTTVAKANMEDKLGTNYELVRLQQRLWQTEQMMERIVSGKGHGSESGRRRKSKTTTSKKEEKLLRELRQITQFMQEGRLEVASPEMEAEEVPYGAEWEGYPDETYPEYDEPNVRNGFDGSSIMLEESPNQPTAEALAERMEQDEEEVMARKLSVVQEEDEEEDDEEEDDEEEDDDEEEVEEVEEDTEDEEEEEEAEKRQLLGPPTSLATERNQERVGLEVSKELQCYNGESGRKQISFSDHKDVFHYPKEDAYEQEEDEKEDEVEEDEVEEEDDGTEAEEEEEADEEDPVMEAESLQFSCEGCSNPEEEAEEDKEEYLLMSASVEGDGHIHSDTPKEAGVSGLRMRNRRET
ncbi:protein RIC-3 [Anabas testudineus]|uniref:protein RIC-3 n=1 Tax=Anabas testudineus TaxID=64144 RepID=UPI000E4581E9|nr:protein RIC-3 [Anabas testudineus]